jgi:hypothetical protein
VPKAIHQLSRRLASQILLHKSAQASYDVCMARKFAILAIFGLAMGHFEGVVVVYLRKALGAFSVLPSAVVATMTQRDLYIEMSREAATILMLVAVTLVTATRWRDRATAFLWTFAVWDLSYYVSLYVLLRWPPTLTTIDVLFLIPKPWIAPVWVPIGISSATILAIGIWQSRQRTDS